MPEEKENHESYGTIGIFNTSGGNVSLFGSSIKHDRYITIRINKADIARRYHEERYFGHKNLIEISMSASQFAQLITTPNVGAGVPCTIKRIGSKQMEAPPYRGQNEIFNEELHDDFKKVMDDSDDIWKTAEDMLLFKGPIKVGDKKKLADKMQAFVQHIRSNMPFLHKQFTRSMDKTVTTAKAEIESFYTNLVMKLGKKAIENGNIPKQPMIENKEE